MAAGWKVTSGITTNIVQMGFASYALSRFSLADAVCGLATLFLPKAVMHRPVQCISQAARHSRRRSSSGLSAWLGISYVVPALDMSAKL